MTCTNQGPIYFRDVSNVLWAVRHQARDSWEWRHDREHSTRYGANHSENWSGLVLLFRMHALKHTLQII